MMDNCLDEKHAYSIASVSIKHYELPFCFRNDMSMIILNYELPLAFEMI